MQFTRPHRIFMGGLLAGVLALTAGCPLVPPQPPPDPGPAELVVEPASLAADLTWDDDSKVWAATLGFTVTNTGGPETAPLTFQVPEVEGWSFTFDTTCGDHPLATDEPCGGELLVQHAAQWTDGLDTTMSVAGGTASTSVDLHLGGPGPTATLVVLTPDGTFHLSADLERDTTDPDVLRAVMPFTLENRGADDTEEPRFEIPEVEGYDFEVALDCTGPLVAHQICEGTLTATTTPEHAVVSVETSLTPLNGTRSTGASVEVRGRDKLSYGTSEVTVVLHLDATESLYRGTLPLTLTNIGTAKSPSVPFHQIFGERDGWDLTFVDEDGDCDQELGVDESCGKDLVLTVVAGKQCECSMGFSTSTHTSTTNLTVHVVIDD